MNVQEGFMSYLSYKTYYRIVGEKSDKAPLLLIHGGPGSTHNYFELLDELANQGRQIIMYDQLGCGLSSMPDNKELWHADTWLNELIALRDFLDLKELHILGHSWGGMLLIKYLCDVQPLGIKSSVFSSTLSSAALWKQEQHRLIKLMSKENQQVIALAEKSGDFTQAAYLKAEVEFMKRHAMSVPDEHSPEPLRRKKNLGRDSYINAWGPNEFFPTGTLKSFDYTAQLSQITSPVLVTSGADDLSTPLVSKTMYDALPNATWELFANSRHVPFVDEKESYLQLLKKWLLTYD